MPSCHPHNLQGNGFEPFLCPSYRTALQAPAPCIHLGLTGLPRPRAEIFLAVLTHRRYTNALGISAGSAVLGFEPEAGLGSFSCLSPQSTIWQQPCRVQTPLSRRSKGTARPLLRVLGWRGSCGAQLTSERSASRI